MLQTFAILLTFQSVGELLTYSLHLPVPGPVVEPLRLGQGVVGGGLAEAVGELREGGPADDA